MDLDFYPKDLYPDKNESERFEFLANVFRRRNKTLAKHYKYNMAIVIKKYPYIGKVLDTFEIVFDNHYPFSLRVDKNGD